MLSGLFTMGVDNTKRDVIDALDSMDTANGNRNLTLPSNIS